MPLGVGVLNRVVLVGTAVAAEPDTVFVTGSTVVEYVGTEMVESDVTWAPPCGVPVADALFRNDPFCTSPSVRV